MPRRFPLSLLILVTQRVNYSQLKMIKKQPFLDCNIQCVQSRWENCQPVGDSQGNPCNHCTHSPTIHTIHTPLCDVYHRQEILAYYGIKTKKSEVRHTLPTLYCSRQLDQMKQEQTISRDLYFSISQQHSEIEQEGL